MKLFFSSVIAFLLLFAAAIVLSCVFLTGAAKVVCLSLLAAIAIAFIAVIVLRAVFSGHKKFAEAEPFYADIDEKKAVETLKAAIRIPSVTPTEFGDGFDRHFNELHELISKSFTFTKSCETVRFTKAALYIYNGRGDGSVGISGHLDVVPIERAELWKDDPFSGIERDGYIYGRGSMDMKGQVFAFLNALEYIHTSGIVPEKDIYIMLTHDEETVNDGAREIARYFTDNNIRLDYTLDEGGIFFDGASFGIKNDIAFVGINEKGYMDVKLDAEEEAGHAAIPPKETAIENISKAIARIQYKKNKARMNDAFRAMVKALLPYMSFSYRLVFANLWLLKPVVLHIFSLGAETNALIRTTVVPTVIKGGESANVLPRFAEAIFNCRINAPDTMESTFNYMNRRLRRVTLSIVQGNEPTPVSVTDCAEFEHLKNAIAAVYRKKMVVAPYQVVASTDSHEYYAFTDKAYRFVPFCSFKDDMSTVHSYNERLEKASYFEGIKFYIKLLS